MALLLTFLIAFAVADSKKDLPVVKQSDLSWVGDEPSLESRRLDDPVCTACHANAGQYCPEWCYRPVYRGNCPATSSDGQPLRAVRITDALARGLNPVLVWNVILKQTCLSVNKGYGLYQAWIQVNDFQKRLFTCCLWWTASDARSLIEPDHMMVTNTAPLSPWCYWSYEGGFRNEGLDSPYDPSGAYIYGAGDKIWLYAYPKLVDMVGSNTTKQWDCPSYQISNTLNITFELHLYQCNHEVYGLCAPLLSSFGTDLATYAQPIQKDAPPTGIWEPVPFMKNGSQIAVPVCNMHYSDEYNFGQCTTIPRQWPLSNGDHGVQNGPYSNYPNTAVCGIAKGLYSGSNCWAQLASNCNDPEQMHWTICGSTSTIIGGSRYLSSAKVRHSKCVNKKGPALRTSKMNPKLTGAKKQGGRL